MIERCEDQYCDFDNRADYCYENETAAAQTYEDLNRVLYGQLDTKGIMKQYVKDGIATKTFAILLDQLAGDHLPEGYKTLVQIQHCASMKTETEGFEIATSFLFGPRQVASTEWTRFPSQTTLGFAYGKLAHHLITEPNLATYKIESRVGTAYDLRQVSTMLGTVALLK